MAPLITESAVGARRAAFGRRQDGGYTIARSGTVSFDLTPTALRHFRAFLPALKEKWGEIKLRAGRAFVDELVTSASWKADRPTPFERTRVLDPAPDDRLLDQVMKDAADLFPQLQGARPIERWAGMIDVTPDEIGRSGRSPACPGCSSRPASPAMASASAPRPATSRPSSPWVSGRSWICSRSGSPASRKATSRATPRFERPRRASEMRRYFMPIPTGLGFVRRPARCGLVQGAAGPGLVGDDVIVQRPALGFVRRGTGRERAPAHGALARISRTGRLRHAGAACSAWSAFSVLSARQNSAMAAPR